MGNTDSKEAKRDHPKERTNSSHQKEGRDDGPPRRAHPQGNHGNHHHTSTLANLTPTSTRTSTSGTLAASPSVSTSEIHGHGATSTHSRQRSVTTGNKLRPDDIASSHKSDSSSTMGQEQSKRAPSRSSTHPPATPSDKEKSAPSPEPVQVPQPPPHEVPSGRSDYVYDGEPNGAISPYGLPASQFDRPPRLPLPIERDPEPASPLISPTDISPPADVGEDGLRRRHSMLSSTTLDDDEGIDAATFNMGHDSSHPKQLTTIVWKHPARQVYITGTFVEWQRKLKMQKNAETGQHSIELNLPLGTHHIMFWVDGEMRPSDEYPTTVDYTNSLMNYIEVMPPLPAAATPMPIPGAGTTQAVDHATGAANVPSAAQVSKTGDDLSAALHETIPQSSRAAQDHQPTPDQRHSQQQPARPPKKTLPRPEYTRDIPEMLLHLDLYNNPDDERYQRASKAMQHLPTPPSLPMFMQKSILNATTPHKDDASVLTMPNHTVLNHLATSSIRSGVLATSGTTRYKRKFLTTIMYKPTSESG